MALKHNFNFTKKHISVMVAVSLGLAGCSDDDNQSDSSPVAPPTDTSPITKTVTITAIDGYLNGANVYLGNECDSFVDQTNENGQLEILVDGDSTNQKVCIEAIKNQTVDMTRGIVTDNFTLAAPALAASTDDTKLVVSPMTNLVVEQMEVDPTLSITEAEQAVVESFNTHEDVVYTHDDIFGDYIEAAEGTGEDAQKAEAINVVGETLVDNDDVLDPAQQLEVINSISETTSEIIADPEQELDENYAPVVGTDEDGNYLGITPNHRPYTTYEGSGKISMVLGDSLSHDLTGIFSDADGDELVYSVDSAEQAGTSVDGSTLIIEPTNAGNFDVLVYASDEVSRSYPLVIQVTVDTPNTAPVLNEQNTLQADLDALNLTATISADERVSIGDLFIDADNDVLTYEVTDVEKNGLSIKADNDTAELHIIGKPENEGVFTFTVTAYDGVHPTVGQTFDLTVAKAPNAAPILEPTQHQRVADELTALELQVGVEVHDEINLEQLFSDDDELTLTVQDTIAGVDTTIAGTTLTLSGTPTADGHASLEITADDGTNDPVLAAFDINVAEEEAVDPIEPVVPAPTPRFEDKHFIGGYWRMGEIGEDEGDLEMGWASLLKEQEQHYFCWKKSIDIDTPEQLEQLELPENKKLEIGSNSDDCWPVDIQSDGTLVGEGEIYTPVYTSENNGDYQLVFAIEGDLFWLDSTENLPFTAMLPVPEMDKTVYQSIDWENYSDVELRLRSANFTVNQQNIYASEVTKSGSFTARELEAYDDYLLPMVWTGTWEISTSDDGKELLSYNSLNSADYEQRYMRQFNEGELRILVAQHGEEVGQKVDIVLESTDLDLLRRINAVWDPQPTLPAPLDPSLLEGKTFYFTEYGSSNGEVDLNRSVVWCDAIKFEDGKYYWNQRTPSNNTTCPTEVDFVERGTYTIDEENSRLVVKGGIYSTTYTVIGDASDLSQGALSVVSYGELRAHFTDRNAVEARLTAKSSTNGQIENSFGFYLPTEQEGVSQLGQVSISLSQSKANIIFIKATDGDDITCELIDDYFDNFELSNGNEAFYWFGSSYHCSSDLQGNVSVDIPHKFTLDSNDVYSLIGQSDDTNQEAVKYNILWD